MRFCALIYIFLFYDLINGIRDIWKECLGKPFLDILRSKKTNRICWQKRLSKNKRITKKKIPLVPQTNKSMTDLNTQDVYIES